MNQKILLVEPAYKSKYPPLGLMKLATYHTDICHDSVAFVRGCAPESFVWQDWDRIYISTLFTYNWKVTVKTIRYYQQTFTQCPPENIFVGGILATLMPEELYKATGIYPITGLLNNPRKINIQGDETNIDRLVPDYSIIKDFDYDYKGDYFGYATRGCKNACDFCAVKKLEPDFVDYHINVKEMIEEVDTKHGEKNNLILMDNNVLASDNFEKIINDIIDAGFYKNAKQPNSKRRRTVDFNQGLDARRLTDYKMSLLAKIPLEPMRVAFDSYALKDIYERAMRLASKHGQRVLSNYILYNYFDPKTGEGDTPVDFYKRLKLNIDLNEEFKNTASKTTIYSFPMKYIPLDAIDVDIVETVTAGSWLDLSEKVKSKSRKELTAGNSNWNNRLLRGMQVILNVVHGAVMPGKSFFEAAFGRDEDEFIGCLLMPDILIRNRMNSNWKDKNLPLEMKWSKPVSKWMAKYKKLSHAEKDELVNCLGSNDIRGISEKAGSVKNDAVKELVEMFIEEEKNSRVNDQSKSIDEVQVDWVSMRQAKAKTSKSRTTSKAKR